jgi:hypothetical protein
MREPLPAQTIDPFISASFLLLPASLSARGPAIGKWPHFDGRSPPQPLPYHLSGHNWGAGRGAFLRAARRPAPLRRGASLIAPLTPLGAERSP